MFEPRFLASCRPVIFPCRMSIEESSCRVEQSVREQTHGLISPFFHSQKGSALSQKVMCVIGGEKKCQDLMIKQITF